MIAAIRSATVDDLQAINDIYNFFVSRSTCTFQTESEPMESRRAWLDSHGAQHPVVVAEQSGDVVGWGSLSRFLGRAAYGRTVEDSIYVRHDCHGRGLGRLILTHLVEQAAALGHHTMLACIAADQTISLELHRRLGFVQCAHLKEVGHKFNRWIDVLWMQRMLK